MKTNFSASLLTPRLDIGAKVRSQPINPQCLVTVPGLLWGPLCPPQADPAPGGQRGMAAGERAGKGCFGLAWFFKRETQESAFLVHFVLLFRKETKQTRLAHS